MQIITLEIQDPEVADMIIGLAKKLNLGIKTNSQNPKPLTNSEKIISIMKRISERGTITQAIPDPLAWQKEIRQDRALPGRE
jgi:hypothetical protein